LNKADIVCLFGELGSGKTILTKGISAGLGVKKNKVKSPSFVLMRQYKGRIPIYHFDFYRLDNPGDILGIGYEEFFYDEGICVIEWADRLKNLLPEKFLKIELFVKGEKTRLLNFSAQGSCYKALLEKVYAHISH
jgi:tRNA threonylcarbamoyladenosine biosynthesis protein TsaE